LDDLRQWTIGGENKVQEYIPIYLSQETMDVVSHSFPYLVNKTLASGMYFLLLTNFLFLKKKY